jgi:phospholipid/cholesterol/gamma-HCH transport system permease protein
VLNYSYFWPYFLQSMDLFYQFGRYFLLVRRAFRRPEKASIYRSRIFQEMNSLGIGSLGIVAIVSVAMGAVITIQSAYNFVNPLVPSYAVGVAVRDSMILEFSPTIVSLILAGKIGSSIASEIGTMRVSEQIDALEVMGINSAGFLIQPKIIAALFFNPILVIFSMFLGVVGGYILGILAGVISGYKYVYGITYAFIPYYVTYALIKTVVFAFIITSVSAYHGYYTQGGALEVGRSSTKAVVYSSVLILVFNFLLTQLLLV